MQRRSTKLTKRVKFYSYRERLEKLGETVLREKRVRGDQIKIFQIMEFLIMVDIFLKIFLFEQEICRQDRCRLAFVSI